MQPGYASLKSRSARSKPGLSIIEVLAASAIVALSLIALVSCWLSMIQASVVTDDRGAAYECARMVVERARANGFLTGTDFSTSTQDFSSNPTLAVSSPLAGNSFSTWSSPSLYVSSDPNNPVYRFYDDTLVELSDGATPPANARFAVLTQIIYSNANGGANAPSDRPDLQLETILVTVYGVDAKGNFGDKLADLETCLTEGGT